MSSGLPKEIRAGVAAGEVDEYELGGYTAERSEGLVQAAFVEPIEATATQPVTFIVGGGKGL